MIVLPCNSLLILWKRSGREYKEAVKPLENFDLYFGYYPPQSVSSKPSFLINKRVELRFSKMFLISVKNHATESSTYWKQDPITSLSSLFQMHPDQQLILKHPTRSIQYLSIQINPWNSTGWNSRKCPSLWYTYYLSTYIMSSCLR